VLGRRRSERNSDVVGDIPDIVVPGEQSRLNVRAQVAAGVESDGQPVLELDRALDLPIHIQLFAAVDFSLDGH